MDDLDVPPHPDLDGEGAAPCTPGPKQDISKSDIEARNPRSRTLPLGLIPPSWPC